MHAKPLQNQLH